MPVVLALLAFIALLLAPASVAAHDLEPTTATPDVLIEIGSSLSRPEVRLPAGSVVGWVNRDDDEHRVRSRSGPAEFDSGNLERGERFAVRLTTPGTYGYVDDRERDDASYHGRIVVTAASGDGGGSTGDGSTGGGPTGGGSTGGGAGSGASSSVAASIGDRVFSPATIRVAVGGSVTWTNDDEDEHTVTASDGSFDSGVMGQGGTHQQRFTTPGTFPFLCAIHPEMQGEVTVVGAGGAAPAPAATPTPTPGPPATPTAAPAGPADVGAPTSATVEMRDFAFGPTTVTVADGGTVTFANTGAAPHTATADDGTFDTGMVAAGSTTSITVEGPGSIAFVCTFHPEMQGTLEVVAGGASGSAGGASPSPSPSPTPSPTASVEPEATTAGVTSGGGATTGGGDTGSGSAPSATAGQSRGLDSLVGIIVGVTLVSIAAALFARTIGGTVRRPG